MKNKKKTVNVSKKSAKTVKSVKPAKSEKVTKKPIVKKAEITPVSDVSSVSSTEKTNQAEQNSKVIPLGDRILIKPLTVAEVEKKNDFGIIIPETVSKETPEQGIVIAVGEGWYHDGKLIPLKVKVGDKVIFSKYGFDEVKVDGSELYILKQDSVLAIVKS